MSDAISGGVFRFLPVDAVVFGAGCVRRLPEWMERNGLRRALIVTGESVSRRTDILWYVEQLLGPWHAASYTGARQHVPSTGVAEAAELARAAEADCLVSLGGGSPIDLTKAIAHRLAFGDGRSPTGARVGGGAMPAPLPHFAVPTTLSRGEFTHLAGVTDEETRVKGAVADAQLTPRAVFLDPALTVPTPERLWLSTGIKALDHAVERFLSPLHQPLTDVLTLAAVRELFTWLPRTKSEPHDLDARLHCQIAAWMSIFGALNVRTGLSHALGHQIGARCDVPHGITSCITLPHVLRFEAEATGERQRRLVEAMGSSEDGDLAASDQVAGFIARLGLPSRLRDVGVGEDDLAAIARSAFHEVAGRPSPTPIIDPEQLVTLLRAMW